MEAYHGSPSIIESWNLSHIGETTGTAGGGFGIYFTTSEDEAEIYGDNIYSVDLSLGHGVSVDFRTLSRADISKLLIHYESKINNSYVENWGSFSDAVNALDELETDTDIIGDLCNATGDVKAVLSSVVFCGYSHAVTSGFSQDSEGKQSKHYIVFDVCIINGNTKK